MSAIPVEEGEIHAQDGTVTIELGIKESGPGPSKPAQLIPEYKRHSLAARYWGSIPESKQPLRHVASEEAQETFLRSLLSTPMDGAHRSPTDWVISLAIHILIVATVVIAPFAFTQGLDLHNLRATYLAMPRPPAAPRPPALPEPVKRPIRLQSSTLTMPTVIPKKIAQIKDEEPPDVTVGGVAGGIPGGETGGVLGGVLGGMPSGPAVPPPPAPKRTVHRVGGDVKPPREISRVEPIYSGIARQAHVEGTVMIDAVIDENGNVVQARVVSGPGLLVASALRAVMQWKYEPTYLDGVPVPISMEVQVNFHLYQAR